MSETLPDPVADLLRAQLRDVRPYVPGASPSEVRQAHGLDELLQLGLNEDHRGPLPGVAEAAAAALAGAARYPDEAYRELRAAVRAAAGAAVAEVVLAHGIQALVRTLIEAVLEPGAAIVVAQPTYGLYAAVAESAGGRVVRVPTRDFHLDLPAMGAAARETGARMVWVCDPNNPSGTVVAEEDWRALLDAVPERCLVVADEAYADYVDPAARIDRVADVDAGRPVIILRTFSKAFALAGLRLGYAIAAPRLAHALDAVQEPFNVNVIALAAGLASIEAEHALAGRRAETAAAREAFRARLAGHGLASVPSAASFVLVDVGADGAAVADALARRGVLVRPGTDFGAPRHVRVSLADPATMERVADEIAAAIADVAA